MTRQIHTLRGLFTCGMLSAFAMSSGSCSSNPSSSSPQLREYTLTVTAPMNGSITSADGSISCGSQCQITRTEGTILELTAVTTDPAYRFALWTEGCKGLTGPTCAIAFQRMHQSESILRSGASQVSLPTAGRVS